MNRIYSTQSTQRRARRITMVAREDSTFAAGTSGEKMAMSFAWSGDGQITSSWQQFKTPKRRSEVNQNEIIIKLSV